MKKQILTLSLTTTLSFASGIPVIDAGSIAQAVMQYSQMMKDYAQMLKDTANFEKQMDEFGVNLTDIKSIYGETLSIISNSLDLYQEIKDLPEDVFDQTAKVKNACNEILKISGTNSIKDSIEKAKKIERRFDGCLSGIANTPAILEDIERKNKEILELKERAIKLGGSDEDLQKIAELESEIEYLNQMSEYSKTMAQNEQLTSTISTLNGIVESEPAKHSEKIKAFSNQMKQNNNTKQAQALTNSMLLELIQQNQKIYELQAKFYQLEVTEKQAKISKT